LSKSHFVEKIVEKNLSKRRLSKRFCRKEMAPINLNMRYFFK
jgi:hypothetical protein